MRLGRGIELDGFGDQPFRVRIAGRLIVKDAQRIKRLELVWVDAQNLAVEPCRLREIARLVQALSVLHQKVAHVGAPDGSRTASSSLARASSAYDRPTSAST